MPYLENLKRNETLEGYRAARFHPSGKLWVSEIGHAVNDDAEAMITSMNEVLDATTYGIRSRYFTWHVDLSKADLERYRAETVPDKIKKTYPH